MNNLLALNPITSFVFFLVLHHLAIAISKPAYNPTDSILTNCGSSGDTPAPDGRIWTGDQKSKFGPIEQSSSKSHSASALSQGGSVQYVPYMTARISQSQFTYTFPVTAGQKFIRGFNRFKDFFDVKAGPFTLLSNFSASFYAEARDTYSFIKEFCFNYAFINGIEIISMPSNLYYTPPEEGSGLISIGKKEKFFIQNDTALENMCRFNVAGGTISPVLDTGMYRLWRDDVLNLGLVNNEPNLSLNYSKIPNYTAPDEVYLSARQLGLNDTNLTWRVPVDQGFRYLVRLHFCEFVPDITKVNERRFDIFIDNQTATLGFDVIESSGGHGTPTYNDYIVTAGKKVGKADDDYRLFITLRPNPSSIYPDAFLNGLEIFKLNDSDGNLAGPNSLVSVPSPPATTAQPSAPTAKKSSTKKILLLAIGGSVMGLLIILSLLGFLVIWRIRKKQDGHYGSHYKSLSCCWRLNSAAYIGKSSRTMASSLPQELCRQFSLDEIKAATNDFHESLIIGSGGFGNVYRGDIDNGAMTVAIKRLNRESSQGVREFRTEIETLSQLRHVNLVSLIGYCLHEGEMVLVYDYMVNGTLRDHLYDKFKNPLPWKQRLEICTGAARGLHYLHAGASNTIIHRDIKTTNILLDENWVAKVSDFGLSKIGVNDSAVSTIVKGTWGYLDPEYARRHQLTEKSDVYSFGVVLLEVLCARKPLNQKLEEEQWNLVSWARKCIQNENIHLIIDPHLIGKIAPVCFQKFVEIAESCVREQGIERPSMHDVMEKLEFALSCNRQQMLRRKK
ncbi:hypothetical protein P3X46_029659 [Hevea brasiliensis]|uniref:Protein kinase domain-containing protein n=1 Tax=Hevea brasiliensis TaxID=3981 RepID=A0ABQ9KSW6_HEVBR|nr:hypothetical protein P3X46_029659 [Hevea brasiliensis]